MDKLINVTITMKINDVEVEHILEVNSMILDYVHGREFALSHPIESAVQRCVSKFLTKWDETYAD